MTVAAIVVAGGRGVRFGGLKQFAPLGSRTVAAHSVAAARAVADTVILVAPPHYDGTGEGADLVVEGGDSRAESVRAGLAHCGDAEIVVVHDAARPWASARLFHAVVEAVRTGADGAIPGLPITDTVKRVSVAGGESVVVGTEDRDVLVVVQTPQAFRREVLERGHAHRDDATDDASLVEAVGGRVVVVAGEARNVKITVADDLNEQSASRGLRIGHGFDVHRFGDDSSRELWLGLVLIPGATGLLGHSDADVIAHAVADALLGAASLGDLGRHFPDADPATLGIASAQLLEAVRSQVDAAGYRPVSVDVTVVAEYPRLAPHMDAMVAALSAAVGAPVSVKATTPERLGAIGRGEGISATAVALVEAT